MMTHFNIAVLPGDGIGVEVTLEALRVLEAIEPQLTGVKFDFHEHAVGAVEYLRGGDPLPASCAGCLRQGRCSAARCDGSAEACAGPTARR